LLLFSVHFVAPLFTLVIFSLRVYCFFFLHMLLLPSSHLLMFPLFVLDICPCHACYFSLSCLLLLPSLCLLFFLFVLATSLLYTSVNPVHNAPHWSPHSVLHISHSGSKRWRTFLRIKISCRKWKAQGCTPGALLLFFLNFGRRGWGGGGRVSFHFFWFPMCSPT
jgi:hypothetical protein